MNYCVDANVFITVWHTTYPKDIFPSLYPEMESKLLGKIILIKPIFDEIEPILPEKERKLINGQISDNEKQKLLEDHPVRIWLKRDMGISETPITNEVEERTLELMEQYETDDISRGASRQDISLIAYASLNGHTVVTLEARQASSPRKKSNYKIPLICEEQEIACIGFTEMLKQCAIQV
ncbi:MAG: DUF4411 family protein [Chromatiales bacterium]|nr:DUF4411 family protein [Chromatiales bacterium]